MQFSQLVEMFTNEFSSQSILNNISQISQYHRIQGSMGFYESAKFIQSILITNGISSQILEYPANGKWDKWGWVSPISWNIISGECWITEPVKKQLCRFMDHPMSVITHSKAADFEAYLVDIGRGDNPSDYKEASGKIALITESTRRIFSYAAKHDVKGLLLHPNLNRAAQIGDSTVQYDGFWPVAENLEDVTSGFSISHKQARELQQYLKNGKDVKLHFKIDAAFSVDEGKLHVLEAVIKGTEIPKEEIVLIAHLCHPSPGANDNTSGSATLLESVLSLTRMINTNQISSPKRTLRFLWVPEFSGTIPWLADYDQARKDGKRKIISVLNLDMVGESPLTVGTPLSISSPSLSTPSCLLGIIKTVSDYVNKQKFERDGWTYQMRYDIQPFAGGSDHLIFNDGYFSIPSVMFGHDDPYHHSSADSMDKVEPLECQSAGVIASVVAYFLSNPSVHTLQTVLPHIFSGIIEVLTNLKHDSQKGKRLSQIQQERQRELFSEYAIKMLQSVLTIGETEFLHKNIEHFTNMVDNHLKFLNQQDMGLNVDESSQSSTSQIILQRNYSGPISYKRLRPMNRSSENQKKFDPISQKYWGGIVLEFLNLVNGKRSLEDIFLLLNVTYPEISYDNIEFIYRLLLEEDILKMLEK